MVDEHKIEKRLIRTEGEVWEIVTNSFPPPVPLSNIVFQCDVNFDVSGFSLENRPFDNSIFEKDVNFSNTIFKSDVSFKNVCFKGNVNFQNAKFEGKVRFQGTQFMQEANFENTRFDDLADFYKAHFYQDQVFYKTDFWKTAVFSRSIFEKNVFFTYSLFDGLIIFRHAEFKSGLDLSLANITGQINVFDIILNNFISVPNPDSEEQYEDMVTYGEHIPDKNKRETFRIIYDQLIKQNNKIDALKYHQLEMIAYSKELKVPLKKLRLRKIRYSDLVIQGLNFISNGYGKSFSLGIVFTIAVALILFSVSTLFLNKYYTFGTGHTFDAIRYFIEFMLPTHKIDFMNDFNPGGWFYIFDFLGRIFISYGIYQTVSAFRKYNKK
jgi:hypothetical protein